MNISIKTIPHAEQRYETVGDWWFTDAGDIEIRVSDMRNWKHEALVGLHEAIEVLLCKSRGITQEQVDAFDTSPKGVASEEPGEESDAPYHREHMFAYGAELLLMTELGVDFKMYADAIDGAGGKANE